MSGKIGGARATGPGGASAGAALASSIALTLFGCQLALDLDQYNVDGVGASGGRGGSTHGGGTSSIGGAETGGSGTGGAAAGCGGAEGCDDATCGASGSCEPSSVELRGRVSTLQAGAAVPGAEVQVRSARTDAERLPPVDTGATGEYSVPGVPLGAALELVVTLPESVGGGPLRALRQTVLAFDSGTSAERELSVAAVEFDWLVRTAKECRLLAADADLATARDYLNARSTVLVELAGDAVTGVTSDQIEVLVRREAESQYANLEPPEQGEGAASVCFLQDAEGGSGWQGSTATQTSALGRFVVFRVRNAEGTGSGSAEVLVDGFESARAVNLVAGQSGMVRVGGEW